MNARTESEPTSPSFHSRLYAPNIQEMLRAPLADLFWGTIETSAVADALERMESFVRHIEIRQQVLMRRAESLMMDEARESRAA